jgi:predicted ATP-grasp superfamily ATP-dependent carboligase
VDLAREVLEEAVELVQVAVRDGQERGGIRLLGARDAADLDLQLVAKALDATDDAHEIAPLEAPGEEVRVAERAPGHRPRPVAQFERQIGDARARLEPVLARAREHGVDVVARAKGGDRWSGLRHAVQYGAPSGRGTVKGMQPLRWDSRPDGLRAPALICAFKGWNDAGESATSALTFVAGSLGAEPFAVIDPEEFVDFQSTRPMVRLVDGVTRMIEWPDFEVHAARVPRAPRDLVLLSGPEPAMRWRTFSRTVVDLAEALGVQMVVLLGALLADVPHSRPVSVTAHATDPALVQRLSLQAPTYEGPTGIIGVLHAACEDAGLPSASLWAAVPHYVAVAPNPKGALALLRRLESLVGVTVDATELEDAAGDYERQVSRAVELDPDVQAFVERLERAADEENARPDPGNLPSGDVLAREFQRFLRQRGQG